MNIRVQEDVGDKWCILDVKSITYRIDNYSRGYKIIGQWDTLATNRVIIAQGKSDDSFELPYLNLYADESKI